jgi:hypothetical protein
MFFFIIYKNQLFYGHIALFKLISQFNISALVIIRHHDCTNFGVIQMTSSLNH